MTGADSLLCRDLRPSTPWGDVGESNPRFQLHKLACYRYTNISIIPRIPVYYSLASHLRSLNHQLSSIFARVTLTSVELGDILTSWGL